LDASIVILSAARCRFAYGLPR